LLLILVVSLAVGMVPPGPPKLVVGESVAADFQTLAEETWERFLARFTARWDCMGDVRLEAVYDLNSRAGYNPETATASVRVPGTAAMLQSGLIHEWAHHVEFQCQEHRALRSRFLAAQGVPATTPWRPVDGTPGVTAGTWANIPSEQYAEAVVELVLGGRPIPTGARVSPEAIRVVEDWGVGKLSGAAVEFIGE
jgi:hypothetical protein